MYICIKY